MIKLPWREYNMSIRYGQKSPYVLRRYDPVKSRCLSVILDHDQIFLLQLHHVTSCHSTLSVSKKSSSANLNNIMTPQKTRTMLWRQGSSCWNKTKSQSARDSHFSDFSFDSMTNCPPYGRIVMVPSWKPTTAPAKYGDSIISCLRVASF